ncbi:MAG: hypothetical protein JNK25_06485 [Phycisphaerae bacterium]|nr:hypothetical protein [Phycisphaerae bacterium]
MFRYAAVTALCAVTVSGASAALYGVASFSNFGVQSLYAIDPGTGLATHIGATGLRRIGGLDWDEMNNRLVALTVDGDQFAIDTATGAPTLIADGSFGVPEGSIAFRQGAAYTTIFDHLHIWEGSAWRQIGPSGLAAGADLSGLDFGGGAMLGLATFGADPDLLVSYDVSTGAATPIGPTGTNAETVGGLAFDIRAQAWYMTDGSSLFRLNPSLGVASVIGSHGLSGFSALAYVPSPGVVSFLCVAGVLITRRRR